MNAPFSYRELERFLLGEKDELENADAVADFLLEHFDSIFDSPSSNLLTEDDTVDLDLVILSLDSAPDCLLDDVLDAASEEYFMTYGGDHDNPEDFDDY